MGSALLDVPPRYMWGWGPGTSGYCGSMTIQSIGIYFGNYVSQDLVRGETGGHDGKHEVLLGRGGCCSAIDIMPKLRLNATQWKYWDEPEPQHAAFLRWMRHAADAGEPVAFGVYMKTESDEDFDHIVPLVGFDDAGRLAFNDLHSNVTLHEDLPAFVSSRERCHAALPWSERFAYCLPSRVNYGACHRRLHSGTQRLTAVTCDL
jgi:hypothetical protein